MAVHNVMEDVIKGMIAEHLDRLHLSCKCDKCREDILALSLNKVPPKYIVKDSQRPLVKAMYTVVNTQEHANIIAIVAQAAAQVSANKRCTNIE
ncbi:late competence development ComFB family protein [Bacillus badius]|uniref:Competence protein ComFB n=1 Tax=Bacillus badius TaxID=1455 RepID=A0ABR5APC9_BACBA|nr:late competence development ComFB family protein [Bacillus badius]KIL74206.1 hypothetical protein SD77_2861 [Bacillus badius]KZN99288.1 hypothetical protein A4244_19205 [Bacillus badius]KZR59156.1 hypothetical protein A3781_14315 [Bacillus badius]MED0668597.1 late competence development ComFB family protein [Bacillus badius]MED4717152.1 late competence development ComFB family protein [Bacillus badius]